MSEFTKEYKQLLIFIWCSGIVMAIAAVFKWFG